MAIIVLIALAVIAGILINKALKNRKEKKGEMDSAE